ncbi:MAG: anti-sigma factor [Mycobacteriaceae bacterium]|nr:anti-sigma factor [Mycobacteriaceae bacterium]
MGEHASTSPVRTSRVDVSVAAELAQLPMLRALAETVALLTDFTLDEVSDVRLAVDEVASILMMEALPGAVLRCELTASDTGLLVRVSTTAAGVGLPDNNSFGWHVLRTLTDSVVATQHPYDAEASGYPTIIEFSRMRSSISGG